MNQEEWLCSALQWHRIAVPPPPPDAPGAHTSVDDHQRWLGYDDSPYMTLGEDLEQGPLITVLERTHSRNWSKAPMFLVVLDPLGPASVVTWLFCASLPDLLQVLGQLTPLVQLKTLEHLAAEWRAQPQLQRCREWVVVPHLALEAGQPAKRQCRLMLDHSGRCVVD
jgi:hypothetical protein